MKKVTLSAIAAMAENRIIGKDNALIWHIPEDLKHFKRTTMGKPVIMGRKSFEALGKPLPGRPHIIISRSSTPVTLSGASHAITTPLKEEGNISPPSVLHYVKSIDNAIAKAREIATAQNLDEIFITGGGEIYKQTIDTIDRLYLTVIHQDYDGDTYFPEFDWNNWLITEEIHHESNPAFTIYTLDRK